VLWLTLKENVATSVYFALLLSTCYINTMVIGDEAFPWCWGGRDAAAVCRLLEDSTSPSHFLIIVVPETQPANDCPTTAESWILHWAQADGWETENLYASQSAITEGAQQGLSWPSVLMQSKSYAHKHTLYFCHNTGHVTPCSQSQLICKDIYLLYYLLTPPLEVFVAQNQQHEYLVKKVQDICCWTLHKTRSVIVVLSLLLYSAIQK